MWTIISNLIGGLFISLGLFVFTVSTFGLFRFDKVLQRIHVAAKNDSLAAFLILIGLMFYASWGWVTLKLLFVIIILLITNPVASHLIAETEFITNQDQLLEELEVVKDDQF